MLERGSINLMSHIRAISPPQRYQLYLFQPAAIIIHLDIGITKIFEVTIAGILDIWADNMRGIGLLTSREI